MRAGNPNPKTEHLVAHQFKPGNAGGPGAPRKRVLSASYEARLEMKLRADPDGEKLRQAMHLPENATWADAVALAAAREAVGRHGTFARKDLREACDGRSPLRIEWQEHDEIEISVSFEAALPASKPKDRIIETAAIVEPAEDTPTDE